MCPHKPEGEYGHINQIMTVHVTCVTGPVTINHVSNKLSHFQLCAIITIYVYTNSIKCPSLLQNIMDSLQK